MPYPNGTYINQILDPAVRNELEQFYSLQQGWESVQHQADGTHGAVTCTSLTSSGPVSGTTGALTGNVTLDSGRVQIGDIDAGLFGGTLTGIDAATADGTSHWTIGAALSATNQRELHLLDRLHPNLDWAIRVYQSSGTYIIDPGTAVSLQIGSTAPGKSVAVVASTLTVANTVFDTVLADSTFSDALAHQVAFVNQLAGRLVIRASGSGTTSVPFYPNGGSGIGYHWSVLNPSTGGWIATSGGDISFSLTDGSGVNTYTVTFSYASGFVEVQRTAGSTTYRATVIQAGLPA